MQTITKQNRITLKNLKVADFASEETLCFTATVVFDGSSIAQARNDGWSFLNGVINGTFTVPGDGSIDYAAVLKTLKDNGYEGWLVVEAEQDPAVAPSYEYAQKGYRTLRGLVDSLN